MVRVTCVFSAVAAPKHPVPNGPSESLTVCSRKRPLLLLRVGPPHDIPHSRLYKEIIHSHSRSGSIAETQATSVQLRLLKKISFSLWSKIDKRSNGTGEIHHSLLGATHFSAAVSGCVHQALTPTSYSLQRLKKAPKNVVIGQRGCITISKLVLECMCIEKLKISTNCVTS